MRYDDDKPDEDAEQKIIPIPRRIPGDDERWSLGEGCRQRRKLPTT